MKKLDKTEMTLIVGSSLLVFLSCTDLSYCLLMSGVSVGGFGGGIDDERMFDKG